MPKTATPPPEDGDIIFQQSGSTTIAKVNRDWVRPGTASVGSGAGVVIFDAKDIERATVDMDKAQQAAKPYFTRRKAPAGPPLKTIHVQPDKTPSQWVAPVPVRPARRPLDTAKREEPKTEPKTSPFEGMVEPYRYAVTKRGK